jgi:transcription elongation factor GreA
LFIFTPCCGGRVRTARATFSITDSAEMTMAQITYYSAEGYEKLKNELHHLKTRERQSVAQAISEAREKGDLRENAEYDAAKEEQGKLEARIAMMEDQMANARILDGSNIDNSKVFILSTVTVRNAKLNKQMDYTLVSANEADIKLSKISVDSPIGSALLGRKVGDKVEVRAPAGLIELEVLHIRR